MGQIKGQIASLPAPVDASRLIVGIVALCSIGIFVLLASKVVPAALGLVPGAGRILQTADDAVASQHRSYPPCVAQI